ACHITAAHQSLQHPACDFARRIMQVALAPSGVWIADGPTILMPIAPHRPAEGGTLTPEQRAENHRVVHHAWRLHAENVRTALVRSDSWGQMRTEKVSNLKSEVSNLK